MAKAKITIGNLSGRAIPFQEGSIILLPVGRSNAKETNKTAQPTTITGDTVQKDRGIEFDYPKSTTKTKSKK